VPPRPLQAFNPVGGANGLSIVFVREAGGIKDVNDDIWLVSFTDYDLGYFDLGTRVLEPLENPFGPKLLPM
jgi:putative transposase